jgi:hypothetical protein
MPYFLSAEEDGFGSLFAAFAALGSASPPQVFDSLSMILRAASEIHGFRFFPVPVSA